MLVDVVFPGWVPFAYLAESQDGVAAQGADAVVPRWIDRLGGADVYTLPNAYQLVESLRIDYGHLGPFGSIPRVNRMKGIQVTAHGG
jgi:hypothetical protein